MSQNKHACPICGKTKRTHEKTCGRRYCLKELESLMLGKVESMSAKLENMAENEREAAK